MTTQTLDEEVALFLDENTQIPTELNPVITSELKDDKEELRKEAFAQMKDPHLISNMLSKSYVSRLSDENVFISAKDLCKKKNVSLDEFNNRIKETMIWFINHEEEEFETNMVFNVQFPVDRAFIRYLDIDNVNIVSANDFQELISNITNECIKHAVYYVLVFMHDDINERINKKQKVGAHLYIKIDERTKLEELTKKFELLLNDSFDKQAWNINQLTIPYARKDLMSSKYHLEFNYCYSPIKKELIKRIEKQAFITHGFTRDETIEMMQQSKPNSSFVPIDVEPITDSRLKLIVEGLKGIKALVHAHSSKLNVYRVICSIKAFNSDEKVQTQLFNEAVQVLNLTEKAKNKFTYEKLITVSKNTHYTKRSLINIIKEFNQSFYNEHEYELNLTEFNKSGEVAPTHEYKEKEGKPRFVSREEVKSASSLEELISIISEGCRNVVNADVWLDFIENDNISIINEETMKKKLKSLLGNKQALEAFDILQQITVIDEPQITFNLIFNGWKYEAKQNSNYERHINTLKQAVIENTFGGDEVAFNYEMKRIAFILKNPGSISKVMTVLLGQQGQGNSTFVNQSLN